MNYTHHAFERMNERKIEVIAVKYALKYGVRSEGHDATTCRYVLTKEKIHEVFFAKELTRDDKLALTVVENKGGLIVVLGKSNALITTYYKQDKKSGPANQSKRNPESATILF